MERGLHLINTSVKKYVLTWQRSSITFWRSLMGLLKDILQLLIRYICFFVYWFDLWDIFIIIFFCGALLICLQPLPVLAHQLLNGVGDLLDLLSALQPEARVDWRAMNRSQFEVRMLACTHMYTHPRNCKLTLIYAAPCPRATWRDRGGARRW